MNDIFEYIEKLPLCTTLYNHNNLTKIKNNCNTRISQYLTFLLFQILCSSSCCFPVF